MRSTKLDTSGMLHAMGLSDWGARVPLGSLNLTQSLDIDEFLALLNRSDPPRRALPLQMLGDIPRMDSMPLPTTQELLRGWVDEWLDSGKGNKGVEDPRDRTLEKAAAAALAAREYSKQGKILLLPDANSLVLWLEKHDKEPTGSLYSPHRPPRSIEYAREQLVFFLLSDVRFRLAKCRKEYCGTYFLLKHWNRQYKGGTLCDLCKRSRSEESAIRATADVRNWAKAQLHDFAAKKFAKQIRNTPRWHQQKELKDRIAGFLNAKIERSESLGAVYKRGITGKWVTRSENWNGIEAALKGGK